MRVNTITCLDGEEDDEEKKKLVANVIFVGEIICTAIVTMN